VQNGVKLYLGDAFPPLRMTEKRCHYAEEREKRSRGTCDLSSASGQQRTGEGRGPELNARGRCRRRRKPFARRTPTSMPSAT
jgi:hypothetical protein